MEIIDIVLKWLPVINGLIATASLAANFTPNQTDNIFLKLLSGAINGAALNFKDIRKNG